MSRDLTIYSYPRYEAQATGSQPELVVAGIFEMPAGWAVAFLGKQKIGRFQSKEDALAALIDERGDIDNQLQGPRWVSNVVTISQWDEPWDPIGDIR